METELCQEFGQNVFISTDLLLVYLYVYLYVYLNVSSTSLDRHGNPHGSHSMTAKINANNLTQSEH